MTLVDNLDRAVSWETGKISPAIYFDDDLYALEQERIFGASWVPVGHADMVPEAGMYVTNYVGEVSVIILRDSGGVARAFVNRCRHRGNKVCLFDRGRAHSFTCSYHGWTYGLDGSLVGVPRERDLYGDTFDRSQWGLEEIRLAEFHGLLFAALDKDIVPLEQWLGDEGQWWLRTMVLAEPLGGLEALPGWHRTETPGNWKFMAENFIGDNYHVALTHASWARAAATMRELGSHDAMVDSPLPFRTKALTYEVTAGYEKGCPLGLGAVLPGDVMFERDMDEARRLGPEVVDWLRHRQDVMTRALADVEPRPYGFINGLLFPTLGLMGFISPLIGRHFILFHPRGTTKHEAWQWTMVERDMPEAAREVAIQRVYKGQHPAGTIAVDDVENFERVVEVMEARYTHRLPFNFEVHMTDDGDLQPGIPGNVGKEPSEVNQRQFYRFWLELMNRGAKKG